MPPQSSPIPTQPPAPAPQPTTVAPSPLKQIRTYQGDVAEALAHQNESLYSIQAKEHAKNGGPATPMDKSVLPLLAGSLLLIAFAVFGGYFAYGEFVRKTAPPPISTPVSRFLPAESSVDIDIADLGRDQLIAAITEASIGTKVGELRYVNLQKGTSTATTALFFSKLEAQVPGSLERALEPVFMAGSLGESRFIIFKLASFPNAFGGMLAWEKTLASDLGPLFATNSILQALGPSSVFKDAVYKNKDVRAIFTTYEDETGALVNTPVFSYSFLDNKILIITDQIEALQTLIDRLTRENLAR